VLPNPFEEVNLVYQRASLIEGLVRGHYCEEDTDAADLALDELRQNPKRTDMQIALVVAQRILQA
jgi:hypothetical protein